MKKLAILKQIGLSDKEATIYLELLKAGGMAASLVAKAIGIKRTTVYPILKHLVQKGFVTVRLLRDERVYFAEKPNRVGVLFSRKLDNFYELIPWFETLEKNNVNMGGVRYLETMSKLRNFYREALEGCQNMEYGVIGSTSNFENTTQVLSQEFQTDRVRKKVGVRLLLFGASRENKQGAVSKLEKRRYIPNSYKPGSTISIFSDKILVVGGGQEFKALVIEIPAIQDIFSGLFELLWDIAGMLEKEEKIV